MSSKDVVRKEGIVLVRPGKKQSLRKKRRRQKKVTSSSFGKQNTD